MLKTDVIILVGKKFTGEFDIAMITALTSLPPKINTLKHQIFDILIKYVTTLSGKKSVPFLPCFLAHQLDAELSLVLSLLSFLCYLFSFGSTYFATLVALARRLN